MRLLPLVALASSIFLCGCASTYKPDDLRRPARITCIYLPTPMSFVTSRGLNSAAETRLERGPYISERVSNEGTFYRGPPGGYSGWPWSAKTSDGGFWIPHDPKVTPRTYSYFSTTAVTPEVPPDEVNCSSFSAVSDPAGAGVSLVSFTAAGAVGGAAGSIAARGVSSQSGMSYGQAAGVGAVGGAVGMLIVAAIINADVGKIILYPWPEVPEFEKLKKLAAQAELIKEPSRDLENQPSPGSSLPPSR